MISGLKVAIRVQGRDVFRCPRLDIKTSRSAPLSRSRIVLPDPAGDLFRSISAGGSVHISLGYRGKTQESWSGTIASLGAAGKDQIEVRAIGPELPLASVKITQAWLNEDAAAIVRYAAIRAGVRAGRIDSPGVLLPKFVVADSTVWDIARQCTHSCSHGFGLDMRRWALWMGRDGLINWGDFEEPGSTPVVATGQGLISHHPAASAYGSSVVTTFLLPGFRAGQMFRLRDRRRGVDRLIRALTVTQSVTPVSARSYISYGEEYEQS